MLSVQKFGDALLLLDPSKIDFVLRVDELVDSVDSSDYEKLLPFIFRFFEVHPLDHCGAPGTLVHLIEDFYPSYKAMLMESLQNRPSVNTILMANRILNSELAESERTEYLHALKVVARNDTVVLELRRRAQHFIDYQNARNS